ncbi:hypothetical protein PPACK8108_LOCUS19208 [Phakopsora pachyrhizi]|uniref:Dynamin-type G domain-containing protein n=1 Tax=Phakopsora pachyrhizi TaxID=170000 RepID=A0AAV0BFI0_PHAPC|nr:hypothetical protein PPACK8108_LOCUS19208 [Phakopsora pachyrhizi]
MRVLRESRAFLEDRESLLKVINRSDQLLGQLKQFGQQFWLLHYPDGQQHQPSSRSTKGGADDQGQSQTSTLNILSIEAGHGHGHGHQANRRVSGGVHEVEPSVLLRQSSASMLYTRMDSAQSYLEDLRRRVIDRNSRILVTGDLNAGKSTFVNALLGKEVAPTDQQPCTEVMCEILDSSLNRSIEQIHAIHHGKTYDQDDGLSYDVFPIERLSELVSNLSNEDVDQEKASPYQLLKLYINSPEKLDRRAEDGEVRCSDAISLLQNGDISVSFIDSPGLNRDTLSTMELFSKQSTIDVVVFVVSAENQFTLSAQEFLWAASQEKAYVFVVVNKWGAIRDKVKAERRIRDQLRKLSPGTWEERSQLVHFVDSQEAISKRKSDEGDDQTNDGTTDEPFDHLQRSLSSFVFLRRSISKLQPAQNYTRNLLHDLSSITKANVEAAKQLYEQAHERLEDILPRFNRLSANSAIVEANVERVEEDTVDSVHKAGSKILNSALSSIRDGKPASNPTIQSEEPYFPTYEGLLSIFQYAEEVRKALLGSLEESVRHAEEVARGSTAKAVDAIRNDSSSQNLLEDEESTTRTFNPKAMFSRPRKFQLIDPSRGSVTRFTTSLGIAGLGDMVDFERLNWFSTSAKIDETQLASTSLVGSIGFGTLTLFGTGVTGGRALVEALVKVAEVAGSKSARKWTGTAFAVMTIGFGIYLITDIPRAIPRNIGKKLEKELNESVSKSEDGLGGDWVEYEVNRMTKETRKVVRLAGWDLRQRFRSALEEASLETSGARDEISKAVEVEAWLKDFEGEIEVVLSKVEGIGKSLY